jgi:hypothetical protein
MTSAAPVNYIARSAVMSPDCHAAKASCTDIMETTLREQLAAPVA